jgi:hypothetical protein
MILENAEVIVKENKRLLVKMMDIEKKPSDKQKDIQRRQY